MDYQTWCRLSRIGWVLGAILLCVMLPAARGGDFRIETHVFAGDEEEPVSRASTLFEEGVVYDFLTDPKQVAVFRPGSGEKTGRFILLDVDRQVRTELAINKIEGLLGKLRAWSTGQSDPLLQFIAAPDFKQEFDEESGELTLSNKFLNYQVQTAVGGNVEAVAAYRTFCDWYARLNAVTQHGMLPYPRLKLNAVLDELGRVPTTVVLTVPERNIELRAEHAFTWRLSKADRRRTDEVRRHLRDFQLVDNAEFRRVKQVAARASSN